MRNAFILAMLLALTGTLFAIPSRFVRAAVATPPAACVETSEDENAAIALRWHEDVINAGDLSVIDEIAAGDIVHHAGTFPDGNGPEAVKQVLGALLSGFPDVQHTVEAIVTDGDFVVTRWIAEGSHAGEFQGYEATGKRVTWTGINIFRIECGKIGEEWSEIDGLGRLAQLAADATPTP